MSAAPELHPVVRARGDWVTWCRCQLGVRPWSKQVEIIRSVQDHARTSVRSCHGGGKSAVASWIALCFLCNYPMSKVATTAPTMRQVRHILWSELRKAYARAPGQLSPVPPLMDRLQIAEDWFAFGFTAAAGGSAGSGLHSETGRVLVVVDEAAGCASDVYDELEGTLSGRGARLLEIGNPTDPLSQFATNQKLPGTNVIKIAAEDTPNFTGEADLPGLITREWQEDKVTRWGIDSPLYTARVLAEFPEVGGSTLIPLPWLEEAQRRSIEPKSGTPQLSLDVARQGPDSNVIGCARGGHFRCVDDWKGMRTTYTARRTVDALTAWRCTRLTVDAIGVGGGVCDQLLELAPGLTLDECNVGENAHDPGRYFNRRSEIFWMLRERFERGDIDIDPGDENLLAELAMLTYNGDDGVIRVTSKKKLRTLRPGMGSPDRADACAMAYAAAESYEGSVAF